MRFANPLFLLLLLAVPFFVIFWKKKRPSSLRFPSFLELKKIKPGFTVKNRWALRVLRILAFILFVLALSRPQTVQSEKEYQTKGVDIVIALDISGSMQAEDFHPQNRLQVAKIEAKNFVKGRQNDRIGLVVFAGQSFTQCPLTLDYEILLRLIDEVQVGLVKDGTAIGMAIANAINRLRESEAKSKIVILITDGENNAGKIDPITAAELAKTFGIKIYTIGVGKGGLVPFPVDDPLFGRRYVQMQVDIDEKTLSKIAKTTNGLYFRARDEHSLRAIYDKIDKLEKTEVKVKEYTNYDELFHYFLYPALVLLLVEVLLANSVFLKTP